MKKYTNYKLSLCIGLLSLNILSACTNMRQELGAGEVKNRRDAPFCSKGWWWAPGTQGDINRAGYCNKVWILAKQPLSWFVVAGTLAFMSMSVGFPIIYYFSYQLGSPIDSDANLLKACWNGNDAPLSRSARSIPLYGTVSDEQANDIMRLIATVKEKYDSNDTVVKNVKRGSATIKRKKRGSATSEDLTTTGPTPASLSSTSATSEGLSDNSTTTTEPTTVGSNATTPQPSDGVAVRNITVIGEKTMKVLQELEDKNDEDAAINFIKCLSKEGLDVNAKNNEKCTLYSWSAKNNMTKVFEFLNDNPNVNKTATC